MSSKKTTQASVAEDLSVLVEQAKQGDQEAFSELYNRTSVKLYRSIRAMTRDEDLSWDIQQDSYLRAYRSLNTLDNNEAFFPWLRRIAANVTATRMKQRLPVTFTELTSDDEDDSMLELPDLNADNQPELSMDRKETARLLQEILVQLPEEQQLIIGMRYYDDLSVKEIADLLNLSTGTVKAQLFHGRKKVETAVRALEKQGVKLYGLSPLPFLLALMRQQSLPMQQSEAVLAKTLAKAGIAAGTKVTAASAGSATAVTAETAVFHATRPFFGTLAGKLVLGVLAAGVVAGSVVGYHWYEKHMKNDPEPVLWADTLENLQSDPTAPTIPVEPDTVPPQTDPTDNQAPLSGTCGEHLTWAFDPETGVLTIAGTGAMDHYNAPSEEYAPWEPFDERITAISLPEGLTEIGSYAFYHCTAVSAVSLPAGLTALGEGAFTECLSLGSISLPAGITELSPYAFFECRNLTSVSFPEGLTKIGGAAFMDCTSLTDLTLPEKLSELGEYAFFNCESLHEQLSLPQGVTAIPAGTFAKCTGLTEISLSDVKTIGDTAFGKCVNLSYVGLYEVTEIGDHAFSGCSSLYAPDFPDTLTTIGSHAFQDCTTFRNLVLPPNLSSIGEHAFDGCTALSRVSFYSRLTDVADCAFLSCPSLSHVTLPQSVTQIGVKAFGYAAASSEDQPVDGFAVFGAEGSAAEQYATENGFGFNTFETSDLAVILDRVERDQAERDALNDLMAYPFGGLTRILEIEQVGTRYLATVERSVSVSITEAELQQAKEAGTITLQGREYRYVETEEKLHELIGERASFFFDGSNYGAIVPNDESNTGIYPVYKVGDRYIFHYAGGTGYTRLADTTNVDYVWLDGDMPIAGGIGLDDSIIPEGGYTLASYLENHRIGSNAVAEFLHDEETGGWELYLDLR